MDLSTAIIYAQKIAAGSLTPQEEQDFFAWMGDAPAAEYQQVADAYYLALGDAGVHTEQHPELLNKMDELIKEQPAVRRVHFLRTAWFRYAAIFLLLVGAATYLYIAPPASFRRGAELAKTKIPGPHVAPGGNKALLTLADGTTIVLDSAINGQLASQGNTRVLKLDAGSLAYNAGAGNGQILYNTISTPKGGQFRIILPDGSNIWLNAASSVRFPTAFTGKERRVEVKGEVYFEIKPDAGSPFNVTVNETEVNVLGTSFNINAYPDEDALRTTLITGSVRVNAYRQTQMLMPGQQAIVRQAITLVNNADTEQVMAWKNGAFNFEHAGFKEAMRQLERWYDIEVVYEKGVPDVQLGGEISRNVPLQDVLKGLAGARVHFRMENSKKLVIMP